MAMNTELDSAMDLAVEYNQNGKALYSVNKYEEAIAFYKKAEKSEPMYLQTYFNLAESYAMSDQYEEAKAALKKAELVDKKNGEIFFHLGNIALLQGNLEEGKFNFNKALSLDFKNIYIFMNLGSACADAGDFVGAINNFNKAIQMDKFFPEAWFFKMKVYMSQNELKEALDIASSMMDLFPDKFEGYHYKFILLAQLGKENEAEDTLNLAIKQFPDDPGFILDKIALLEKKGEYAEAEALLDKAFFEAPNSVEYAKIKVQLLLKQNKIEEATQAARSALETVHDDELAILLANVLMAKEQYEVAIEFLNKIIEKKRKTKYYYSALYFHAVASKKNGYTSTDLFESALIELRTACLANQGNVDYFIFRALAYKEIKNYDRAYEMVEYVMALSNKATAEALIVRAEIHKALNKMDEYHADRNKALEMNESLRAMIM